MNKKRILTWHADKKRGNGRWRKQIDGKLRYFGGADSPDDTKAYRAAERKYLEFMQAREAAQSVTVYCSVATVADVCEKFLQQLHERYQRSDVSASYVEKSRCCLDSFTAYLGPLKRFRSVGELTVEDYKSHTLALPRSRKTGRPIKPATAKDRLSMVHALFRWAWKMRIVETLPRNLEDIAKVAIPRAEVRIFSLQEVRALWQAASPRLKCWMALAINCGYGQQDISDLRAGEVDWASSHIDRKRSKTQVRAKHMLWNVTMELMEKQKIPRAADQDRLFLTKRGNPLVWRNMADSTFNQSDSVRCAFWKLQRRLGINGGRSFYSLRRTGATLIERIDPAVTEMYLAHAEKGMKQLYAQRDWTRLENALHLLEGKLELPA